MGIGEERKATEKWTTFKLDEIKYDYLTIKPFLGEIMCS